MLLNILHAIKLRRLYAFPFVFICLFLIAVFRYVNKFFPQTTLEQILFFISTPCDGADSKLVFLFVKRCLAAPFVHSMLICYAPEIKKGIDKVLKNKYERNYALLSRTKSAMFSSTCLDEESSNISSTSLALTTDSCAKLRAYSIAPQFVKISIASSISS